MNKSPMVLLSQGQSSDFESRADSKAPTQRRPLIESSGNAHMLRWPNLIFMMFQILLIMKNN